MSKRSRILVNMAQNMHSDHPKPKLTLLQNVKWSSTEPETTTLVPFQNSNVNNDNIGHNNQIEEYSIFTEAGIELNDSYAKDVDDSGVKIKILQDVSLSSSSSRSALHNASELEPIQMVNAETFIRLDQSFSIKPTESPTNNNIELTFIDLSNGNANLISNEEPKTLEDINMKELEPQIIEEENTENLDNGQEIIHSQQPHEPYQEHEIPQHDLREELLVVDHKNEGSKGYTKKGEKRKRRIIKDSVKTGKEKRKIENQRKHYLKPPCSIEICKTKCINNINENRRKEINSMYWKLNWVEKKSFVLSSLSRTDVKRRTTEAEFSQRKNTFKYFLTDETGEKMPVCKVFFLATLGYHKKNDWAIQAFVKQNTFRASTPIYPQRDGRGKAACKNKIPTEEIDNHIESFSPNISHYRRDHAPYRKYLPSDLTIESMHRDYLETYPHNPCSYEVYRKRLKHKNISFTNLGHEECELCEGFKLHNTKHNPENMEPACTECINWKAHIGRAKDSRDLYRLDVDQEHVASTIKVSVDLQKVIMLPRLDMFKKAIFTQRISVYNESFVPLGKVKNQKAFACLWHEGIAGRGKEEIISSYYAFFLHNRDVKHFVLWVDNCSGQNKNWSFLSFLVYIVNSDEVAAKDISINYFEPGHTFMSADSFHHQVELSLKKQKKTYDFDDFATAVGKANSGKVDVKTMQFSDFYKWLDFSSQTKIKNTDPRPYLAKITQIVANRESFSLNYKLANDSDKMYNMNFLQNKILKKGTPKPKVFTSPCGVPEIKKTNILKNLQSIIPLNRSQFWKELDVQVEKQ